MSERVTGEDWYGEELVDRVFTEVTFTDVDLTEATTRGVVFDRCRFHTCRFNASTHVSTAFVAADCFEFLKPHGFAVETDALRAFVAERQLDDLRHRDPLSAVLALNKAIYDLCVELEGADALLYRGYAETRPDFAAVHGGSGDVRYDYLRSLANSIEGGTSEVLRNVLGERVLGLPGEPRVDKSTPWADLPRG